MPFGSVYANDVFGLMFASNRMVSDSYKRMRINDLLKPANLFWGFANEPRLIGLLWEVKVRE